MASAKVNYWKTAVGQGVTVPSTGIDVLLIAWGGREEELLREKKDEAKGSRRRVAASHRLL